MYFSRLLPHRPFLKWCAICRFDFPVSSLLARDIHDFSSKSVGTQESIGIEKGSKWLLVALEYDFEINENYRGKRVPDSALLYDSETSAFNGGFRWSKRFWWIFYEKSSKPIVFIHMNSSTVYKLFVRNEWSYYNYGFFVRWKPSYVLVHKDDAGNKLQRRHEITIKEQLSRTGAKDISSCPLHVSFQVWIWSGFA